MARFRFQLEALLRLRELEEEKAKKKYYGIRERFRAKEAEIDALTRVREEAKARYRRRDDGDRSVDVEAVLLERRYINVLYQRIVERGAELRGIGEELEAARRELAFASQRREVVDKIRERRLREFELEQARRERREADEIGQIYASGSFGPQGSDEP